MPKRPPPTPPTQADASAGKAAAAAAADADAAADLAGLFSPVAESKRIRQLERLIEQQAAALERARKPRAKFKASSPPASQSSDFVRIIIPDTHGAHIDEDACKAFMADFAAIKPRQVVMVGDHIDCGGFLAQHHTLGYVAETSVSFEDDVGAANAFLDAIQAASPGAEIHFIEGNHERRIERWCTTEALRNGNPKNAAYLTRLFSTENVLSLESRGVKFYKQGRWYCDLRIPATIKLGHCYFTHGTRTGKRAAETTLADFGANVVFGHTHRISQAQGSTVETNTIMAWNIGCLCKIQPYWMHTHPTGWGHGYGLQFCRANGDFLHVNVPIVDGRSLLVPLTRLVG